jgi:hypothetical protein
MPSAEPNIFQRGLNGMRETLGLRQPEAGKQGRVGDRGKRGGLSKLKSGLKALKARLGFSDVDLFNEDMDEQRRKRKAREFFGDDDPRDNTATMRSDAKRDLSTIDPMYRAQVTGGLARANSKTTGSTLVGAAGGGGDGDDERW